VPAAEGTPILASAGGVVVRAASHRTYGLSVILLHTGLSRLTYTLYAHLSTLSVALGDRVVARAPIGAVGQTGRADGPHLHFEVLEPALPLRVRTDGPIGLDGESHRIDPASVVDVPAGCRREQLLAR
jgi:murein DD-endopeptidase MepM/ murein hydrolase activator NlpD